MQCQICCVSNPLLYSISDCEHRFCLDCCVTHVSTKSQLFTDILCPDNTCKKPFTKPAPVWNILPTKVIDAINKRQRFAYLSNNPHIKQCSQVNCTGLVNTKQSKRICDKCSTPHCPKCMKPFHENACIITNQDKEMRRLGYQKCPQCNAWVEKKQGCNYVDCKCGCNFCYVCGVDFQNDPCRLKEIRTLQLELRRQLATIKFNFPKQKSDCLIKILKFPFKLLLFIVLTILLSILVDLLVVIGLCVGVLISPILIMALACEAPERWMVVLAIIFLPVLTALLIVVFVGVLLLYPCLRKTNHHGAYDGIDVMITKGAQIYVNMIKCIFD